jgi:hypothetical protein
MTGGNVEKKLGLYILIFAVVFSSGCAYAVRHEGDYTGRIIDEETGAPLEGVVVLGAWYKEMPTVAGAVSEFYDARETLTDSNGEFTLQGLGLGVMSNVTPAFLTIFKAGYSYEGGYWESFTLNKTLRERIKWEGKKAIIPLKKLTMAERNRQGIPDIHIEPRVIEKTEKGLPVTSLFIPRNIKLMVNEINKELVEQGRKPLQGE